MNKYFFLITLFVVCVYSEMGARHVVIDQSLVDGWEDASTRWLMVPEYHECVYVGMLDYDQPWIDDETGECNFLYIDPFFVYERMQAEWFSMLRMRINTFPDFKKQCKLPRGLYFWRSDGAGRTWKKVQDCVLFEKINLNICFNGAAVRYYPHGRIFSYAVAGFYPGHYVNAFKESWKDEVWIEERHTDELHASLSWYGIRPKKM